MSQLPPSSPPPSFGAAPRPPGYPPTGYPPPPGPGYGQVQPQPKTSAAAVTSFILGLLGCVPFVTSLLAVIFGLVGYAAAGKPLVKGRGLAVFGLLLGLLGLLVWTAAVAGTYSSHANAAADERTARDFVADLAAGRVAAAVALCQPSVPPDSVQKASDSLQAAGTVTQTMAVGFDTVVLGHNFATPTTTNAFVIVQIQLSGGGTRQYKLELVPGPGGKNLIASFEN